jgi:hypothetical protein
VWAATAGSCGPPGDNFARDVQRCRSHNERRTGVTVTPEVPKSLLQLAWRLPIAHSAPPGVAIQHFPPLKEIRYNAHRRSSSEDLTWTQARSVQTRGSGPSILNFHLVEQHRIVCAP